MDEITIHIPIGHAVSVLLALSQAVRSNGEETDKGRHCKDVAELIRKELVKVENIADSRLREQPAPLPVEEKVAGYKSKGLGV